MHARGPKLQIGVIANVTSYFHKTKCRLLSSKVKLFKFMKCSLCFQA